MGEPNPSPTSGLLLISLNSKTLPMSITVIKEGDHLRIISSSEPIPENTPMELFTQSIDPWQAAQLESVFREDEDWGHSLDHLIVKETN